MLSDDIRYRMAHHDSLNWQPTCDVTEVTDGPVVEDSELRVTTAPTEHAPARPSVGYRIEADGKVMVIAGDTVPCEGLDRLCAGADVYVQTVVRRSMVEAIPAPRLRDILDYHSSLADAAATARRASVGTLVLTHPVPPPPPGSEPDWVGETAEGFDGRIVLAHDLWELEL